MRSVVLAVMVATGCGGGDNGRITVFEGDAAVDAWPLFGACDVLAQTGCMPGHKCTWLIEQLMPSYVARVGCAPDGTAALGGACMYSTPVVGQPGYDECVAGAMCSNFRSGPGTCKAICNLTGGAPACSSDRACATYAGLFTPPPPPPGQPRPPNLAGVCDPVCDPLADNDFDGDETLLTRTGTTCGTSATVGCFGIPSYGAARPTAWTCSPDIEHFSTGGQHGTLSTGYINGCKQGYATLGDVGCHAFCSPGNTYSGNPGTQYPQGKAPHACNAIDARGNFTGNEHCVYLWRLEIDAAGHFTRSPTSDSVGVCISDSSWPDCSTLPLTAAPGQPTAADYGCVDTATAPALPTTRIVTY